MPLIKGKTWGSVALVNLPNEATTRISLDESLHRR
jgi:hypothetical protein